MSLTLQRLPIPADSHSAGLALALVVQVLAQVLAQVLVVPELVAQKLAQALVQVLVWVRQAQARRCESSFVPIGLIQSSMLLHPKHLPC
jgi:hypothetical protein